MTCFTMRLVEYVEKLLQAANRGELIGVIRLVGLSGRLLWLVFFLLFGITSVTSDMLFTCPPSKFVHAAFECVHTFWIQFKVGKIVL